MLEKRIRREMGGNIVSVHDYAGSEDKTTRRDAPPRGEIDIL
jgi:hypothetical protein